MTKTIRGRTYDIPNAEVAVSNHGQYRYFLYTDTNPYKWDWEASGAYFLDMSGKVVCILPVLDQVLSVGFSPDDNYIVETNSYAMDIDTLQLFTFPDFRQVATVKCVNAFWYESRYLLYTTAPLWNESLHIYDLRTVQVGALKRSHRQNLPACDQNGTVRMDSWGSSGPEFMSRNMTGANGSKSGSPRPRALLQSELRGCLTSRWS